MDFRFRKSIFQKNYCVYGFFLQFHLAKIHRFFGPLYQIEVSGFYERLTSCA